MEILKELPDTQEKYKISILAQEKWNMDEDIFESSNFRILCKNRFKKTIKKAMDFIINNKYLNNLKEFKIVSKRLSVLQWTTKYVPSLNSKRQ